MSENLEIKELQEVLDNLRDKLAELQFEKQKEQLAKNTAQVAVLTQRIQDAQRAILDQTTKLKEAQKAQEELTKSQKKYSESIDKATGVIEDFRSGVMNVDFSFNNYSKTLNSASKGLVEATGGALSFTAAAFGYTKVSAVLEVATKASSAALQKFSELLLAQAGSMLDAFDSIASIGGASTLTSSQIEQFGSNADFSGEALKFFGKITKEQGSNLTAFGGSVGKGVEEFSQFINLTADQRKQYRLLGITQNQLAEYQGFYADNLLKSGMSIDRFDGSVLKLQQSSLAYRDILMALSNISGESLEEQQKALDFQAQNANFQATLAQKDIERVRLLEEADKLEEGAAKDALIAEADKIQKQAELMKLMALEYSPDKVGVDNATAMLEMLATGGEAVTENTVAFDMLNPAIRDTVRELSNFSGENIEEGIKDLIIPSKKAFTDAVDKQLADLGPMAGLLGKEILSVWGISTEGIAESARLRQATVENMIAAYEEATKRNETTETLVKLTAALAEFGIALRGAFGEVLSGFLGPDGMLPSITNGISSFTETIKNTSSGLVVGLTLLGGAVSAVIGSFLAMKAAAAIASRGAAYVARRRARSTSGPSSGPTPGSGPTPQPATPSGTSNNPTTRVRNSRGIWTTVPNPNYVPPTATVPPAATASPSVRPSTAGRVVRGLGRFAKFIPGIGTALAVGQGAYDAYQGFTADTSAPLSQRFMNAGSSALSGLTFGLLGSNPEEIAARRAGIENINNTGDESVNENVSSLNDVSVADLNNSFDDLKSTTDMLIEAFGSLNTIINSSNVSNRASGSFDTGNFSASTQVASTTPRVTSRSFDTGTSISEQETKDFIIGNEGIRYSPYEDTLGNWTVGVGHLIGNELPPEMNRRFSHQEVMDLFDSDYMHHRNAAERIPGFNKMDDLGQAALTDLTFNMGPNWINGWPNLSRQLGEGDIPAAADNLRNSRWYSQVGNRGPRVANMIENSTMISAAQGGIAQGPETGYLGKLHGTELIQPINSDSILAKLATAPDSGSNEISGNSSEIQTKISEMYRSNIMLIETLNSKLDNMIGKLDESNYIQGRILSNTV